MYRSRVLLVLLLMFSLLISCEANTFDFSRNRMIVVSNGDKKSAKAADYFYNHLHKRIIDNDKFVLNRTDEISTKEDKTEIYFELVEDLATDYEIINEKARLSIIAKDQSTLRWLSYLLIDYLSGFHKIEVSDLPPSYLDFSTSKSNFTLHYRDIHLQPNMNQDVSGVLNTHNVDEDWGLWGHNLERVFVDGVGERSKALVKGKRDDEQFCFSADETFDAICDFVIDQYGRGESSGKWFMITPNDNDKVCTCESCVKLGNTSANATPAVVNLLNRLAEEYPNHHFFTTAYRTTKEAPSIDLIGNSGVLLSTIDLSKAPVLSEKDPSVNKFVTSLNAWKKRTSSVYLWDYISNFDEYLTPFPVLNRFQKQLKFFKQHGVEGVFLNGSGYDYSPFDDVKTYVLSALMVNSDLSVDDLVRKFNTRFYPKSNQILTKYYLDLEKSADLNNKNIGLYVPFSSVMNSYLDVDKFLIFYKELEKVSTQVGGNEKERIDKLLAAMSFVKLQIAYHKGGVQSGDFVLKNDKMNLSSSNKEAYNRLAKAVDEGVILNYKEEAGSLEPYLNEWKALQEQIILPNKVKKVNAKGLSTGDYYRNGAVLTDRKRGFRSDFNQGWFLIGEDVLMECLFDSNSNNGKELELVFLINNRHRMLAPDKVELLYDGKVVHQFSKNDFEINTDFVRLKRKIKNPANRKVDIRIIKSKEIKNSVIACDEIQIF